MAAHDGKQNKRHASRNFIARSLKHQLAPSKLHAMKIIVIGASGTIGQAVAEELSKEHDVVRVARSSGDYRADLTDADSLRQLFETCAPFEAVISCAGAARFASLDKLSDDDFAFSLQNKLMGQVNLARLALEFIADNGSITLTSGVLANEPMPGSGAISLVNAGLQGFVRAAALETPRGVRINIVSPPWVSETLEKLGRDVSTGMPAAQVAAAYRDSLESERSGVVIDARDFKIA